MRRTALAFALLLAGEAAPAASAGSAEHEVEAAERALIAAIAARDLDAYARLVDPGYVAVRPGRADQHRAQIMDDYRSGRLILHKLEVHDLSVHVDGDTAVLSATATNEREENGKIVPSEVRYVRVWIRRDGRWRALAQMAAAQTTTSP